ncbi:MAG: SIS domain-containing protein [Dehalococcoidia bacterium]|nr:SIS domain-containing protein [Dehalococcoidia bacterium]
MALTRRVAKEFVAAAERGANVYVVGNGGSAAMASHFTNDLMKGAGVPGQPAIRAFCLNDNVPLLTAWSNDDAFEVAIQRQVEDLARAGDLLVVISTSGRSPNLVNAARAGRERGARVIAMTCRTPSPLSALADDWLPVETDSVPLAEALFDLLCHAMAWDAKAIREGEDPP